MTAPRSDADAIRAWLDEKDALASKATSGPWRDYLGLSIYQLTDAGKGYALDYYPDSLDIVRSPSCDGDGEGGVQRDADAAFIADARTSLPAALAMVRVLVESHGRISGMSPNAGMHMLNESLTALARVRRIAEVGHGATSDALRIKERG